MFYFYYYTYWCSKTEKIFSFFVCFGTWKGKAGVEPRSVLPFSQYFFWYKIVYNYCLHSFPLLMIPYFSPCLISQSCRIQKIDWTVWVLWRFHIWRVKKENPLHSMYCRASNNFLFQSEHKNTNHWTETISFVPYYYVTYPCANISRIPFSGVLCYMYCI